MYQPPKKQVAASMEKEVSWGASLMMPSDGIVCLHSLLSSDKLNETERARVVDALIGIFTKRAEQELECAAGLSVAHARHKLKAFDLDLLIRAFQWVVAPLVASLLAALCLSKNEGSLASVGKFAAMSASFGGVVGSMYGLVKLKERKSSRFARP